jgi:hypothetical protein
VDFLADLGPLDVFALYEVEGGIFDRAGRQGARVHVHIIESLNGADVTVLGWPKEQQPRPKRTWIDEYSDHGCLYLETQKVYLLIG